MEEFFIFRIFSRDVSQLCSLNGKFSGWNLMISHKIWDIWENGAFWLVEIAGHMTFEWNEMKPQCCFFKRKWWISLFFVTLLLFQVKFNPGNSGSWIDLPAINLTRNSEKKSAKWKPQVSEETRRLRHHKTPQSEWKQHNKKDTTRYSQSEKKLQEYCS